MNARTDLTNSRASHLIRVTLALTLLGSVGCSAFVPWSSAIEIEASDPMASLFVNDEFVGTGRATVRVPRNRTHVLEARLDERRRRQTVREELSRLGILDAIGGMLWYVPYLGLFTPGAWEPMEQSVRLELPPAHFAPSRHLIEPGTGPVIELGRFPRRYPE